MQTADLRNGDDLALLPKRLAFTAFGRMEGPARRLEPPDAFSAAPFGVVGAAFSTSYAYDGLHRRVTRTEDGAATRFYYNLRWQVLAEADDANSPTAIYSYHPKYVDAVAVRITPTDEHFFTHDALFNVTAAIERTTKNVVERYAYSPYGTPIVLDDDFSDDADNKSDFGNEYLFTGRRTDPGTGLQINRYRYYHAPLGRWVNRDPIRYRSRSFSLYAYVDNSPTAYLDPDGLKIRILGPGRFEDRVEDALKKLRRSDVPEVLEILNCVENKESPVVFIRPFRKMRRKKKPGSPSHDSRPDRPVYRAADFEDSYDDGIEGNDKGTGRGTGGTVWVDINNLYLGRRRPRHNPNSSFSPESVLLHELVHACDCINGNIDRSPDKNNNNIRRSETRAVGITDLYRKSQNEELRESYDEFDLVPPPDPDDLRDR